MIAIPMGLLCLTFIPLALDCCLRLTTGEIIVNHFFSFGEQRYSYRQVRLLQFVEFVRAPNGNVVRRPHFIIGFMDGSHLTSDQFIADEQMDHGIAALRYVSRQSGKPIQRVPFGEGEAR